MSTKNAINMYLSKDITATPKSEISDIGLVGGRSPELSHPFTRNARIFMPQKIALVRV